MSFSTSSVSLRCAGLAAAAIALIGAAGCSGPGEQPASPTSSAPASSTPAGPASTTGEAPRAEGQGSQALLAAARLAATEVSGGTVVSVESERGGWEVHVVTPDGGEQQLRTDNNGEKLMSGPTDERPDADDLAENKQFAKVGVDIQQALRAIETEVPDGQVTELSLDLENRLLVWEADVTSGTEQRSVQIDGDSGKVVSNRVDD